MIKKEKSPGPGNVTSEWLMEIVACFLGHTSFLSVWVCRDVATNNFSSKSPFLWLEDWLVCLLLSFFGVCVASPWSRVTHGFCGWAAGWFC